MFFAKKNLLIVLTILQKFLLPHFSLTVEIFQSFKFWQFLKPLQSTVQNGSKFVVASMKEIIFM